MEEPDTRWCWPSGPSTRITETPLPMLTSKYGKVAHTASPGRGTLSSHPDPRIADFGLALPLLLQLSLLLPLLLLLALSLLVLPVALLVPAPKAGGEPRIGGRRVVCCSPIGR